MRTAWSGCWLRWHAWLAAGKRFRPDSRVRGLLSLPHIAHIYSAFLSCLRVSRNRFCFLLIQLQTRQALWAYEWVCFASCLKFSAISPSNGVPCPLLSSPNWLFDFSYFLLSSPLSHLLHRFPLSTRTCKCPLAYPDSLNLFLKLGVAFLSF